MDHEKFSAAVKDVPIVTIGESAFILTEKGLVNLRHVALITSDSNGLLVELHGGHTLHQVVKSVAKPAVQAVPVAHPFVPPASPSPFITPVANPVTSPFVPPQ